IRPGWYYHPEQDTMLKSVDQLMNIYYKSIGRNANLLLNVPADTRGKITAVDSARLMDFAAAIAKESMETGKSLRQIVLEKQLMNEEELAEVLNLEQMSTIVGTTNH
ncbi:MAG: alpha-L-fucosidase, partial [Rivularia sp. ALOHA_DT_140]|nr:alpha-L-fucosidase [Rivularia sp. ALOHA_DT_140]